MNKAARRFFWFSLILLMHAIAGHTAFSADSALDELVDRMQKRYHALEDLSATFDQETVIPDFKKSIRSHGSLFLKKKDKMKLAYLFPKREEIFIDGTEMTTYLPEQNQAIRGSYSQEQDPDLPLRLLSGEALLAKEFDFQLETDSGSTRKKMVLRPLKKESQIEKIELEIDSRTGLISWLRILQTNQNASSFRFWGFRVNSGIRDSVFQFSPPPGTEILRVPEKRQP